LTPNLSILDTGLAQSLFAMTTRIINGSTLRSHREKKTCGLVIKTSRALNKTHRAARWK